MNGKKEVLEMFLFAGADVNVKSRDGHSLLALAIINDDTETAKVLLDHGANVNGLSIGGNTGLHIAAS